MKDEIKANLDAAFQKHSASTGAATEAKHDKETKEQTFLREFMEAREKLIRPAMQEIGEYIKGRGYDVEILAYNDQSPLEGRGISIPASITFAIIFGERTYRKDENPGLSIICDKHQQRVRFHERTSSPHRAGHSESAGEAALSEVTKELVQEKISKLVADVFG